MPAPSYPAPTRSPLALGPQGPASRVLLPWALLVAAVGGCAGRSAVIGGADQHRKRLESAVNAAEVRLPKSAVDPLHRSFTVSLAPVGETLISEVVEDDLAFDEALPSWSVAGEQAFTVEIRVRRPGASPEGIWSPWLRIGDWGAPARLDDTPTQFKDGKVAVDVLTLTEPHDAAQLRFLGPEGALVADDFAVSMVLSDTRKLDATLEATRAEPWKGSKLLRVAPRSQRAVGDDIGGRICSPTSVSMVAAYHGASIPTRQMAEALLDPNFDIYGNWNRAVQGPAALGVPGRLVRVSSWSTVAAYLDRGLPVVASIKAKEGELAGAPYKKTAGHLFVVTGLGPAGAVHVNDPAARLALDVPRVYQRADMERVWFANGGVGYVFGPKLAESAQ